MLVRGAERWDSGTHEELGCVFVPPATSTPSSYLLRQVWVFGTQNCTEESMEKSISVLTPRAWYWQRQSCSQLPSVKKSLTNLSSPI